MKIIDLLNKIANGEEVPANIKYDGIDYYWCNSCKIYERIEDGRNDLYNDIDNLNDEIEIIEDTPKEDKKIEKIKKIYKYKEEIGEDYYENILEVYQGGEYEIKEDMSFVIDKINEIIDRLNEMENKI